MVQRRTQRSLPRKRESPARKKPTPKTEHEKKVFTFKLFDRWDNIVTVQDPGLKNYINLSSVILPRSAGIHRNRFHKSKMHIVERLALKLLISGHIGKRHRVTSGKFGGNYSNVIHVVEQALELIEKKEQKNPLQILVTAIENGAMREEVISYQLGSIIAREAVITAPQRRVDRTLRFIAQVSYKKVLGKKKKLYEALAEELIAAAHGSADSLIIKEKDRIEREAVGAR
ncbi:MAG: 30S ribosomal protein S7 [Candidatus Aenigmarchaeota archaeon]|nr:30S ribosomal protein S7 [Candidatus Aenigmarchaeota archaeon]